MATATDLELELEKLLEGSSPIACDFKNCSNVATHMALCPKCPAFEYFCTPHVEYLRNSPEDSTGQFDKSCGHHVSRADVKFIPLL